MDFVSYALHGGQKFRALAIVDDFTRESLAIEIGTSLKGADEVSNSDSAWENLRPFGATMDRSSYLRL